MIELKDVRKSYSGVEVLKGISLTVEKGEVVAVLGASGSGKSTLLVCINGLEPIDSGQVLVDGIDVHARGTNLNELRQKIGIVFQQFNVFPHMTVIENVALAPRVVSKLPRREALQKAREQIARVGLVDKLDAYPSQLSGGQQQRVAIARALAMEPGYILLDEITSALDPELVGEVLDTLRMLSRDGMSMLVVTHEIPFAREVADRVVFVDEGVVRENGTPEQVIDNSTQERTRRFLMKVRQGTSGG
jgi:polar amino acid transport system ATP-binding protein